MKIIFFPFDQKLGGINWPSTCLKMVGKHYKKTFSLASLPEKSFTSRQDVLLPGIDQAAEAVGLRTINVALVEKTPFSRPTCLPMFFFDGKMTGNLGRVQPFIIVTVTSILFMFVNLLVFAIARFHYNSTLFSISFMGSTLYLLWILLVLKKRKELENKGCTFSSGNQIGLIRLTQGMQEIKRHSAEKQHRWNWQITDAGKSTVTIQSI